MFKRNLWIVALVAALAMVFVGCGEEREDKSGSWEELDVDWKYIRISERNDNWQGVDIRAGKAGTLANWTTNQAHTITVYGMIYHASPLGQEIKFGNTDNNWNDSWGSAYPRANGKFMLQHTFDWDRISDATNNIRISVPASVATYYIYEIIINDGTDDIYIMSEDDDAAAGGVRAGVQHDSYSHGDSLVVEGQFTKWLVAALDGAPAKVTIRNDAEAGGFVPVDDITFTQTKGLVGLDITLPTEVDNALDATNGDIVWSITNAGGTGATNSATNNVITGITTPGTIVVKATVENGQAEDEDFEKSFNIAIQGRSAAPFITIDFDAIDIAPVGGATVASIDGGKGYSVGAAGPSTEGYGWIRAMFPITFPDGIRLSDYDSITFTYTAKAGDTNNYKTIQLIAAESALTSYHAVWPQYGVCSQGNYTHNVPANETATINVNKAGADFLDAETIFIGFFFSTSADAHFEITNVRLIPGTASALECGCDCEDCLTAGVCDGSNCGTSDCCDCCED